MNTMIVSQVAAWDLFIEAANASVATLSAAQLEVMQPIAVNDAVRFLP